MEENRYVLRIINGIPVPFRVDKSKAEQNPDIYMTWKEVTKAIETHFELKASMWKDAKEEMFDEILAAYDDVSASNKYLELYGTT